MTPNVPPHDNQSDMGTSGTCIIVKCALLLVLIRAVLNLRGETKLETPAGQVT